MIILTAYPNCRFGYFGPQISVREVAISHASCLPLVRAAHEDLSNQQYSQPRAERLLWIMEGADRIS
jgi:hypothetical protein